MREQETENITTLDETGKLKIFDRAEDLVTYFVKFRLGYYVKRKTQVLENLTKEILMLEAKTAFVAAIAKGEIVLSGAKKADLIHRIGELGIRKHEGSYDFLLSMPVYSLTAEKHAELLKKIEETKKERTKVEGTSPEDSFLADLAELRKELVKKSGGPSSPVLPPAKRGRVEVPVAKPPVVPAKTPEFDLLSYFK